jgi:2-methylcitrate dehydratase PrpD
MTDVTAELAEFAAGIRYDALPAAVRTRVEDIVLDAFANALAGYDAQETAAVLAFAAGLGASEESSLVGGGRLSTAGAVVGNGYLITAMTVCDIHRPTTCHVTPEVVAPALVVAERNHCSGAELLAAVAAGLETTTRVGLGLRPPVLRQRGWHAPGIIGPFGGAAATGRLLGFDGARMAHAFGLAASQAAGTYAHLGTPTMKFQQARGALSGMLAGTLAAESFTSGAGVLTHPDGLFATYSDGGDPDAVLRDIGDDWELTRISLRRWPVAVHLLPVVTGLLRLTADGIRPDRVRVAVSPLAYDMHAHVAWDNRFRARLSTPWVTAVVLRDGRCGFGQFTAQRVADPAVALFARDRVEVVADPELANGTARIEVDGRTEHVAVSTGEPSAPLTRADLVEKFREAAAMRLRGGRAEVALELLDGLAGLPDVGVLLDVLRTAEGR